MNQPKLGRPYDWPGLQSELALEIIKTLPLTSMNVWQIKRIKELLIRVDALEGFK